MISKKIFLGSLRENLKRRNWSVLLCMLLMFVVLPLKQLMKLSVELKHFEAAPDKFGAAEEGMKMIRQRFLTGISFDYVMLAVALICAVLLAVHGYSYLFSLKKLDMYLSVPVSDKKRYLIIYFNGFMIFALSYFLMLFLCLAGGVVLGIVNIHIIILTLAAYVCNLIFFAAVYNLSIIAVMLTGNVLVSLLACGVLLTAEVLLRFLADSYFSTFFRTFSVHSNLMSRTWLSPVMLMIDASQHSGVLPIPVWDRNIQAFVFPMLHLLLLAVLFGVAAWLLYRRRPPETSARTMAFPGIKKVLKLVFMVPIGLATGYLLWSLSEENLLFAVIGLILGTVLAHCLLEALLEADFRAMFSGKWHIPAALGICLAVFFVFYLDLSGYDSWIPAVDEVAGVSFSCQQDIYGFSIYKDPFDSSVPEYMDGETYILDNMNAADQEVIEAVLSLVEQDHEEKPDLQVWKRNLLPVSIKYILKNGKTVYRCAGIALTETQEELDRIWLNDDYQRTRLQILTPEFTEHASDLQLMFSDGMSTDKYLGDMEEFIRTYSEDLKSYSAALMLQSLPVGRLNFSYGSYGKNAVCEWNYPVYREFAGTIELLKNAEIINLRETGIYADVEQIQSITLTCYNLREQDVVRFYDGSETVSYLQEQKVTKTFFDPEDVEAILPALYPEELVDMAGQTLSEPFDTRNYNVTVVFHNGVRLDSKEADRFVVIRDRMPEYIRRQLAAYTDVKE